MTHTVPWDASQVLPWRAGLAYGLLGFVYTYVHENHGLAAATACHMVAALVLHVMPSLLAALRRLAPGLMLSPASGDELAQRLGLKHYPVLITATGIEP